MSYKHCGKKALGPGLQSEVNYNELELQFKSISSNFIG